MKTALHIDWLALQFEGVPRDIFPYKVKKLPYGSKEFKELYEIYYYDQLWATLSTQPSLPSLPGNFYILKIDNRYCYDSNLWWQIEQWKIGTKSRYIGLSRVDLCLDFNEFIDGVNPAEIIRQYAGGEIDSMSKMGGQVIRGKEATDPYEYMALGSRSSAVRVYLYNKTKEMEDNKVKDWILKADKAAGLDLERDIWRLEFSLKSQAMTYLEKRTGEVMTIDYDRIRNESKLKEIVSALVGKYFRFVPSSISKNRYRQREINLMPLNGYVIKRLVVRNLEDSTRSDRIFLKKFVTESITSQDIEEQDRWHLVSWIYHWAESRNLGDYLLSLKYHLNL